MQAYFNIYTLYQDTHIILIVKNRHSFLLMSTMKTVWLIMTDCLYIPTSRQFQVRNISLCIVVYLFEKKIRKQNILITIYTTCTENIAQGSILTFPFIFLVFCDRTWNQSLATRTMDVNAVQQLQVSFVSKSSPAFVHVKA